MGQSNLGLPEVIHRVNNHAAVILAESELALLLGNGQDHTQALTKVVQVVEEMRGFLRDVQTELESPES